MVTSMTIAVDLASRVFELAVANERYRIIERHRLSRAQFLKFFVQREPCQVVMEACGTAHYWARELVKLGHQVRLLREQGILLPEGSKVAVKTAPLALDEERVPLPLRHALLMLLGEIHALEERVAFIERELKQVAAKSEAVQQLMQVPGIGLLSATALVASAGAPQHFRSGRHLAAWLGLTPREHSSGNRRHLGAISKRGDVYVRTLLVHGARSVLLRAKRLARQGAGLNRLQAWAVSLEGRVGHNKAACAIANKLARISWAIWSRGGSFDPEGSAPALAA